MPSHDVPRNRVMFAAAILVALTGCSTELPTIPPADDTPGVHFSIQAAIKRADESKESMVEATIPASLVGDTMTVIWEGDAAEILKRIAVAQKLSFKPTGPQPRLPLPVFVKLRGVTLTQALEAIGEQCGGRADVILNESSIELRAKLY
jgi:hypothetical protein